MSGAQSLPCLTISFAERHFRVMPVSSIESYGNTSCRSKILKLATMLFWNDNFGNNCNVIIQAVTQSISFSTLLFFSYIMKASQIKQQKHFGL